MTKMILLVGSAALLVFAAIILTYQYVLFSEQITRLMLF